MGAQSTGCGSTSGDARASADSIYELICPSGRKSSHAKTCPPLRAKIFRFAFAPNQTYSFRRLVPHEGRLAIVTDAGRDAVDAAASGVERDRRVGLGL